MQDELIAALDLRTATTKQIRAIEKKARRDGVTFNEAAKNMLLEAAEKQERRGLSPIAALFSFARAH